MKNYKNSSKRIREKERIYVQGIKPPFWKSNGKNELSEETLGYALEIFLNDCEISPGNKNQKKMKEFKTKLFAVKPDYIVLPKNNIFQFSYLEKENNNKVELAGMIFEFDGDKHYQSSLGIQGDKNKMKEFERLGFRKIRIPYYFQLTKDLAKFIFDDLFFYYTGRKYYSEEKYYEAIKKIYKDPKTGESLENLSIEDLKNKNKDYPIVYSPGLHSSKYVPASMIENGLKKINDDFKWKGFSFPESAKYQYFRSLELYIDDNNHGEKNILPHHTSTEAKKFMKEWKKFKQNPKDYYYKDVFFRREPY